MSTISANDLKSNGVSAVEAALVDHSEAIITVNGKKRFVVMPLERYQYLRECELEVALAQSREDLAAGRAATSSIQKHLERLELP